MRQYTNSKIKGVGSKDLVVSRDPLSFDVTGSARLVGPKNKIVANRQKVDVQAIQNVVIKPAKVRKKKPSFFGYIDDPIVGKQLSEEFRARESRGRK